MQKLALMLFAAVVCAWSGDKARFSAGDELVFPANYREWIFLSSGLGMTYGPNAPAPGDPLRFDNVYVNPSSYREFLRTGRWVDGTVMILEVRNSESKGSINQHGHFQSNVTAIEAHVKDSRRFQNSWGFYDLSPRKATTKPIAAGSKCETCHVEHGAVDTTFVQFYPDLLSVAQRFGRLAPKTAAVAKPAR